MAQQQPSGSTQGHPQKTVAYIMSRFPKISETFIMNEILELERLGLHVEIFPLLREQEQVMHPEAAALVARAHYSTLVSQAVLAAQLYWLLKQPRAYFGAWWQALWGNRGSRKFFVRALAIVPQAALFARQMQRIGVAHVHAHWATHPALAAFVIHRLTDLPYSFTAHAHDIYVDRTMLTEKIRDASFVVTISEFNRRLLREHSGSIADKTVVIHCGADLSLFQPQAAQPNAVFTIGCVARLDEMKGQRYLIEACAKLKAQNVAFTCVLVGDGPARAELEAQIARLDLNDQVRLLGRQPRDRVSEIVAAADVIAMPSVVTADGHAEGIPVALMEALAMERPVVTSAISGLPELIIDGETGLLVPERDVDALVAALLRLRADPELGRRLGAAGRTKVLHEFDLRRNAEALYDMLMQDWPAQATSIARTAPGSAVAG